MRYGVLTNGGTGECWVFPLGQAGVVWRSEAALLHSPPY